MRRGSPSRHLRFGRRPDVLLGVVLYLMGHEYHLPRRPLRGHLQRAVMAGGEWLTDSENGLRDSCVMGAPTGPGAILPALPYAFERPRAVAESVWICVSSASGGRPEAEQGLRDGARGDVRYPAVIFRVVLACGLVLPGAAA